MLNALLGLLEVKEPGAIADKAQQAAGQQAVPGLHAVRARVRPRLLRTCPLVN